jgi:hypothetical protein
VSKVLELAHDDLCGPVKPATPGGRRYFLLLVDDATHYMWVMLLASKLEAVGAFKHVQAAAEKEYGRKLRVHRLLCRRGGHSTLLGTVHSATERGGGAAKSDGGGDGAGAPEAAGVPADLWGEAVVIAVYLQNRLQTKSLVGRTPYEAWHGRKPAMNHLHVVGSRAFVKQLSHADKLADRSHAGSSSATPRVRRHTTSSIWWLGRCARRVMLCSMRRMAGTRP